MGWPSSSASRWEITFLFKCFFTRDPGNPIGPSWLWLARTLRPRSIARNPHSCPGHLHLEGTKQAGCVTACVDHDHREFDIFQLIWFHLGKLWQFLWTTSTIAVVFQLFDFFTHLLFSCFCWLRWQGDHVWVFDNGQEDLESVLVTRWPCLFFVYGEEVLGSVFVARWPCLGICKGQEVLESVLVTRWPCLVFW